MAYYPVACAVPLWFQLGMKSLQLGNSFSSASLEVFVCVWVDGRDGTGQFCHRSHRNQSTCNNLRPLIWVSQICECYCGESTAPCCWPWIWPYGWQSVICSFKVRLSCSWGLITVATASPIASLQLVAVILLAVSEWGQFSIPYSNIVTTKSSVWPWDDWELVLPTTLLSQSKNRLHLKLEGDSNEKQRNKINSWGAWENTYARPTLAPVREDRTSLSYACCCYML